MLYLKIHKIYSTTMYKLWKSKYKKLETSAEKSTCVKYMELQMTAFISICQLPVEYIWYYSVSSTSTAVVTKCYGQSYFRFGHLNRANGSIMQDDFRLRNKKKFYF